MARKKGLPFVVQPRLKPIKEQIGTEESGIIEIERKGYLTVAEKAIVQGASTGDASLRQMYSLAGRIAREVGRQQGEVAQDVIKSPLPEYLEPWNEEIAECLMSMVEFQERSSIIQATALIMCRIDTSWTIEQTMDLHPDLLTELALLYVDEDNKSLDALEKGSEPGGAEEGKG